MVALCIKKIMVVWSLSLLGGFGDVPEPKLPKFKGCPKWFVIVKNQGLPVCGGALITHVMAISSCDCVSAKFEEFIIRRPVVQFTLMIETTRTELDVDMIVPHPMCELETSEFPKFGTAMIKTAWGISLDPKKIMPIPLFTLMLESEFMQFENLLSRPSLKCGVMVKPQSSLGSSPEAKCKYQSGVMVNLDVKLHHPADCLQYCLQAPNASCPADTSMSDYDLYCLLVLNGGAKSSDPIQGTPLVCEDRAWGLMFHFHHDIDNIYFFYGIRSVVEIYSMAVTFSIGNDCGGNKIVITKMRSRKSGSVNLRPSPSFVTVLLAILSENLNRN